MSADLTPTHRKAMKKAYNFGEKLKDYKGVVTVLLVDLCDKDGKVLAHDLHLSGVCDAHYECMTETLSQAARALQDLRQKVLEDPNLTHVQEGDHP